MVALDGELAREIVWEYKVLKKISVSRGFQIMI